MLFIKDLDFITGTEGNNGFVSLNDILSLGEEHTENIRKQKLFAVSLSFADTGNGKHYFDF